MNVLLTMLLLLVAGTGPTPGPTPGDPVKDGLRFYAAGQYGKAVTAFRDALIADPDNARLNYNLALALWRAGDADAAETAAEKAAALAKGDFDGLRDGILGNLRYDQAKVLGAVPKAIPSPGVALPGIAPRGATPPGATSGPPSEVERLEKAVGLAGTARNDFQSSAVELLKRSPSGCAEVQRNLERAIKLEAELKKRLEEAKKKQREQQKKSDKNKKNDKNKKKKNDKKKDPTKDKKNDKKKNGEKKPDDKKSDEKKEQPEPDPKKRPEENKKKQPKPETKPADEKKNKPHKPGKPQEVPGEFDPNKQLTPEQRHELLKRLKQFEASLQKLKAARKAARPKVKKDW